MADLTEALSILGIIAVAGPIIYILMKATEARKRDDDRQ